jgi:hypothetical protein
MIYFPNSQIKTNLYTNGGEFIISLDKSEYIGYYYETSNGKKYTGPSPGIGENLLLSPYSQFSPTDIDGSVNDKSEILILSTPLEIFPEIPDSNVLYSNSFNPLITSELSLRKIPKTSITHPTPQNYQEGKFTRYFTKKTNELKYKEISEDTYKKLKNRDEQIAWDLYEPEKIEWEISGNKQIIARNNKQKVIKIEQNKRWYGFSKFLKEDYTKYWKP